MFNPLSSVPAPAPDDAVKNVTLATFKTDVLEASKKALILVDFWATWCEPCKQLTPTLEKIVHASKGAIKLAKIDVDKNQAIAQQMGVQSLPSVFAFSQGRPVDAFSGALPESQIKAWLDQLIKTAGIPPSDEKAGLNGALKQAADFLAGHDITTARSIYADILDMDPLNVVAFAGLVRCFLAENEVQAARELIERAPPEIAKDKGLASVRASLELLEEGSKASENTAEFEAKVARDPNDHQSRFDLALVYFALGKREEAVDCLLEIVKRMRSWNDDAARKQLVKFFEALGPVDPLTISARKRLSSILFS